MKKGDLSTALGLVGVVFGSLLVVAMFFTAGWERPPMEVTQVGYRGVGMETVTNPRTEAMKMAVNQAPEVPYEVSPGGQPVSELYENVQVLGHLNNDQFNRLMLSITEWVSPDQGCAYCHNEANLADDSKYTKTVARGMLQMTMAINKDWDDHVKATGRDVLHVSPWQSGAEKRLVDEPGPGSSRWYDARSEWSEYADHRQRLLVFAV